MSVRKKFRAIMAGKRLVLMPGAYDALSARIMEAEGFEALCAGGYAAIGSMLAQPDTGQSNMRDYADHYGRIAAAVEIPVYVDADTGFGGVNNVRQLVRAFEAAGVAGIFISDQVFPNRCGYLPGKQVIPVEQMLAKIKAALDARRDADFFIAGRTDAAGVDGLNAAIERCQLFMDAGADMAKAHGRRQHRRHQARHTRNRRPAYGDAVAGGGIEGAQPGGSRSRRRRGGDVPVTGLVRRSASGAQRAAHSQAGELADSRPSSICCRSTIITDWSGSRSSWRARKATTGPRPRSSTSGLRNSRRTSVQTAQLGPKKKGAGTKPALPPYMPLGITPW